MDDDGRLTTTKKKTRRNLATILLAVHAQDGNPDQGRRLFKCSFPNCFYQSFWKENVGRHEKVHDKKERGNEDGRDFPCGNCNRIYKSRVSLLDHVETIHEGQQEWPLKCGSCDFNTENLGQFKLHIFQHNNQQQQPKKLSVFQVFKKKQISKPKMKSKIIETSNQIQEYKPLKCPISECEFRTKFKASLYRHNKTFHQAPEEQKSTKNLRSRSLSRMPGPLVVTERARETDKVQNSDGKVQHKCPLCGRKFQSRHYMLLHMRVHRRAVQVKEDPKRRISAEPVLNPGDGEAKGAKRIKKVAVACEFPPCEYKTKWACNMQRHVLRYHEQKKDSAPTAQDKKEPVRLPTGMFKCPICTYESRMRSNITNHVAVHSDLMPFVCKKLGCDYRTRWLSNLRKHQQSCKGRASKKRCFGKKRVKQEQSSEVLDEFAGSVNLEQPKQAPPEVPSEIPAEVFPEDGAKYLRQALTAAKIVVKADPEVFTGTAPEEIAPKSPPEVLPEIISDAAPEAPAVPNDPPQVAPAVDLKLAPELLAKIVPEFFPKSIPEIIPKTPRKRIAKLAKRRKTVPEEPLKAPSEVPVINIITNADGSFQCSLCSYKSRWKTNLKSHMMVHSNEKPHGCSYPGCTYRSKWSQCVRQHSRIVHKVNMPSMKVNVTVKVPEEECLFCSYLARLAKCLTKHMSKCPKCFGHANEAEHDNGGNSVDNDGAEEGKLVPKLEQSYAFIL